MKYEKKSRLPACILNELFLQQLWGMFQQETQYNWQATVGSGGNLLTKNREEVPPCVQTIQDQDELVRILQSVSRIDQLTLAFELEGKGLFVLAFKNVDKAFGVLLVSGDNEEWVEETCDRIAGLVSRCEDRFVTQLFGSIGYGIVHSVIPLVLSSIIVVGVLGLLIPGEYRRSDLIGWISVISILITLRLAYSVSNYLLLHVLQKYPYIRWGK